MSAERGALKHQISQAKIKTLKLTLVVVICFFVCWAPFCITQLIMAYCPETSGKVSNILFFTGSQSFTTARIFPVVNKSIYLW